MLIEGHTDSKPFNGDGSYSNWELSTDRANSARKIMQANGLRPEQVAQVRGYADRQLRQWGLNGNCGQSAGHGGGVVGGKQRLSSAANPHQDSYVSSSSQMSYRATSI